MRKIRINHLARELAVRSSAILACLPSIGITKKKNHSSSIALEEADRIRTLFPARALCPKCGTNIRAEGFSQHVGSNECLASLASKRRKKAKSGFARFVSGGLPDSNRRRH